MDGQRQTGSSLSRVLERMRRLGGPRGMYGTVFGTQAVLHVADPETAALVLSQHTKSPGYDHFRGFFGRGVFTADGEDWRQKRASVAHAMFRGGSRNRDEGGQRRDVARGNGGDSAAKATSGGGGSNVSSSLEALANEEAESVLREVDAIMRTQDDEVAEVEIVRLLQSHTLNLIHRFLCGGDHIGSSPDRKRLVTRYLNAVTDMRMVILARSRSVWMFAGDWIYRTFSPLYVRESRNMGPIQEFAELVLETSGVLGNDEASCEARSTNSRGSGKSSIRQAVAAAAEDEDDDEGFDTDGHGRVGFGLEEKEEHKGWMRWLQKGRIFCGRGGGVTVSYFVPWLGKACLIEKPDGGGCDGVTVDNPVPWLGKGCLIEKPAMVEEAEGREKGHGHRKGKETAVARRTALADIASRESHRHRDRRHRLGSAMIDETITLLFAGQDTTAATLSWTMHLLSLPQNREYLLEVHREAAAAAACTPRPEERKRLPMVDACIREAQRLYPVAPFVVRHLRSDLRLKDGTLLPAGALTCVWIYGLHRHPGLWENPDAFLPRRWLDGAKQPAGAFIPYASGPRGCVGRPFASAVLPIILARLCLALDFSPAPGRVANAPTAPVNTAAEDAGFPSNTAFRGGGGDPGEDDEGVTRRTTTPPSRSKSPHSMTRKSVKSSTSRRSSDVSGDPSSSPSLAGQRRCCSPGRGRSEEMKMQAGFTVLPKGGVHLRLAKWPEDDEGFRT